MAQKKAAAVPGARILGPGARSQKTGAPCACAIELKCGKSALLLATPL